MATSELIRPRTIDGEAIVHSSIPVTQYGLMQVLTFLASLRLTVVLFAASIFLIFVGSLAQKDHDVWEVVNNLYFSRWFALVEFRVFERLAQIFNKNIEWNLTHGFYFPGGKLIGSLLLINLATAHALRFKVAASGRRLTIGLGVLAAGVLLTYGVISSGMNHTVATRLSPEFCNTLWEFFRGLLAVVSIAGAYFVIFYRGRMGNVEWGVLLGTDILLTILTVWLLAHPEARLDDSGIRILWQLLKCTFAGLVLLVGCVMVFRKRAGIVLLHSGVALMMIGQLLTSVSAVESRMTIPEGGTTGFSDDIRAYELAVTDHSPADTDRITVVPASLLSANVGQRGPIEHPDLPFKIQVHQWLPNSKLRDPKTGETNPATAGLGTRHIAENVPRTTGVGDDAAKVDYPSAYVELIAKDTGKSLGTYLTSLKFLDDQTRFIEQPVDVGGRKYDIALRFQRIYHPFTLSLKKFSFDRYTGTHTAKNYSSLVQFKDPERNIEREVLIWMNNPLRYEGTTFYQQSFDEATEKTTVLQVVSNASWMTPYAACMLVAIGMVAHFGTILFRFLRRRADEVEARTVIFDFGFASLFPAIIVLVFAGYIMSKARMPSSTPSEMQIYEFGKLPVAYQGRIKPYDTLARNSLQIISSRQEVGVINDKGKKIKSLPAIEWLLDVISGAEKADEHRVFRIENADIIDTLGLEKRPGFWRYSMKELRQKDGELDRQFQLAGKTPDKERSLFHNKLLQLRDKYYLYTALVLAFRSPPLELGDREKFQESLERTRFLISELERIQAPHGVPPTDGSAHWTMLVEAEFDALVARASKQTVNPATLSLSQLLGAYAKGDAATFNQRLVDYRRNLADYEQSLASNLKQLTTAGVAKSEILSQPKIDFEVFFNQFSPFYYASVLYLVAFVLGVFSWIGWTRAVAPRVDVAADIHLRLAYARPRRPSIHFRPAADYKSVLHRDFHWLGRCAAWRCSLRTIYRLGLGNIAAAAIGFLTLLVAYNLSLDGDTFIVLQAVLDTQFWLATHVITHQHGLCSHLPHRSVGHPLRLARPRIPRARRRWRATSCCESSTARSASRCSSASSAQSSAAYGPTIPGAASGAGTRKKTAPS